MDSPDNAQQAASGRTTRQQWASYSGCSARWTGLAVCHCASCHATLTGISAFDLHRKGGRCHDPATVGLVRNQRGHWGYEPMSEGTRALWDSE